MDYKQLVVRGISYSQTQSGAYALLLEHLESSVKIPVVIGNFEAQSISLGLEKDLKSPRPLTHDIFANFVKKMHYQLKSVVIYQIIDGVFFSNMIFLNPEIGDELVLDARTSDAVAMAVRFDCPIYTTAQVLNEAGVLLEIETLPTEEETRSISNELEDLFPNLSSLSMEELQSMLNAAVQSEDFDTAVEIQEELKKRK